VTAMPIQKQVKTTTKQKNSLPFTKSNAIPTYRAVRAVTWTTNRSESISL
jgi:hypothetical protein